jgi:hypothetical protein
MAGHELRIPEKVKNTTHFRMLKKEEVQGAEDSISKPRV